MAKPSKKNQIKYNRYLDAVTTLAPGKTFNGVTLTMLKEQVGKSETPRENVIAAKNMEMQGEADAAAEDVKTLKMCEKIKLGILGDDDFGDDSALYEALGLVPRSKKKSGLTRRSNTAKNTAEKNEESDK